MKAGVEIAYYLVIVIVDKTAIIGNPFISLLSLDLSHHNKQEYVNIIPASLFFLPKLYFLLKNNVKKNISNYLVIILVNKITTIGNPYTNFISMDIPHHDRPEHMNSAFISLSFLPKSWLLPKKKRLNRKKPLLRSCFSE